LAGGWVVTSDGHGWVWVQVELRIKHEIGILSMGQAFHELAKVAAVLAAAELELQGRTLFQSLLPLVRQWVKPNLTSDMERIAITL
jgi:hypothetical protein